MRVRTGSSRPSSVKRGVEYVESAGESPVAHRRAEPVVQVGPRGTRQRDHLTSPLREPGDLPSPVRVVDAERHVPEVDQLAHRLRGSLLGDPQGIGHLGGRRRPGEEALDVVAVAGTQPGHPRRPQRPDDVVVDGGAEEGQRLGEVQVISE